jgi:nucleoside-diphosphate-sugar epimerase
MAPSLFMTGATGYIGGDFLALVTEKHPDWDLTALVRSTDKGAKVAKVYPSVKLVYGDLDATDLIAEEASKADIILHFADCDHEPSAKAIIEGMNRSPKSDVFYIHTSGTGVLLSESFEKQQWGEELKTTFDDWDGIKDLWSLPDAALHRNVDKIVQSSWSDKIKSAIVCPPTIYGATRGPDKTRSIQVNKSAESMLKFKEGWIIGSGTNVWNQVHVQDLSDVYLLLAEAAANGGEPATWNEQGYYFAGAEEFRWGDIHRAIAKEAHKQGYLPSAEVKSLNGETIQPFFQYGHLFVGSNARGRTRRIKKLLGWSPHQFSLLDDIPRIVEYEAELLGLKQGHAAKVAT